MSGKVAASYNVIGTAAAPATLTAAFTGNTSAGILAKYLRFLTLDVGYTPATTNAYVVMVTEVSDDEITATPTNWYPIAAQSTATTENDVFTDGGTGMGTASGIPDIIPGDKTSVIARKVTASYWKEIHNNWVRVKLLESGVSSDYGTVNVVLTTSN